MGKGQRQRIIIAILIGIGISLWWIMLPSPLFDEPYSTVLLDRHDRIIGLKVADDEQMRFGMEGGLPTCYVAALLTFEDRLYPCHRGVNW